MRRIVEEEVLVDRSVPANWCGEIVTCLCGEGCDGLGSSTWAPVKFTSEAPGEAVVISWSDAAVGRHELCWNCGLVVAPVEDGTAPLATVADALSWTDATGEVIFGYGGDQRDEWWAGLRVWAIVGRLASWQITSEGPGLAEARENCEGLTEPLISDPSAYAVDR